jgi:DNA-directed RNA polymerase subunit RPC12/RpoP
MIIFRCMHCTRAIRVPDAYGGRRVVCPVCSAATVVPGPPQPATSDVPELELQEASPQEPHPRLSPGGRGPATAARTKAQPRGGIEGWLDAMRASRAPLVMAVLVIAFGIAWLLTAMHIIEGFDWLWTFALALTGLLVLALGGINKQTCLIGPFLLVCAFFSMLRQAGWIDWNVEIPLLVISFGVIWLATIAFGYALPDVLRES